jgi:hypothetical protein
MRFDKVKLVFVFCNLLGITIRTDFSNIALLNEAQNGNGICLVTQRVKIGLLEVATEEGQSKILRNMMHGLVGGERTKPLGHIMGDFVENCHENVDR